MSNLPFRAASYAARPLLLRAEDAESLMRRLVALDPRAMERPSGPFALLRRIGLLGGGSRPSAMEDDDYEPRPPMTAPAAYAPIWLGGVEAEGEWGWSLRDGIALFNLDSPLGANGVEFCGTWFHGYDTISAAIDEMIADTRVKAIFIHSDCPGGVVHGGLYALATKLRSVRGAAGGKPIWVYADMAASAAYWLASSCDRIIAPRVGMIGSIGCVLLHVDYSAALAKDGIVATSIQFGEMKTDAAEWKPLSDSARAKLQAEIDQIGRDFVADVVAGRPQLSPQAVIDTQAACYLAYNDVPELGAVGLGLADEIMTEPDAFAALAAHVAQNPAGLPAGPAAPAVTPPAAKGATGPAATKENDVNRSIVAALLASAAYSDADKLAMTAKLAAADAPPIKADANDDEIDQALQNLKDAIDKDRAEDADEGDPEEEMPAASVAEQILDLPEARGREALAKKLAFRKGETVASARALLAAAPKASALADRMAGRDPNLTPGGGGAAPGSQAERGRALVADAKARKAAAKR